MNDAADAIWGWAELRAHYAVLYDARIRRRPRWRHRTRRWVRRQRARLLALIPLHHV